MSPVSVPQNSTTGADSPQVAPFYSPQVNFNSQQYDYSSVPTPATPIAEPVSTTEEAPQDPKP
jgi:hypothetical protein